MVIETLTEFHKNYTKPQLSWRFFVPILLFGLTEARKQSAAHGSNRL